MHRRSRPIRHHFHPSRLIRHFLGSHRRSRCPSRHSRPNHHCLANRCHCLGSRCRLAVNRSPMAIRFGSHSLAIRYRLVVSHFPTVSHFGSLISSRTNHWLTKVRCCWTIHRWGKTRFRRNFPIPRCFHPSHCYPGSHFLANRWLIARRFGNRRCLANCYRLVAIRFRIASHSGSPMASRTSRWTMSRYCSTTNRRMISCRTTSRWKANRRTTTSRTTPTRLPTKTTCSIRNYSLP